MTSGLARGPAYAWRREPRPTLEQWARAYERRGWTVVPVRYRGKAPTQRGWAARRGPLDGAALREHFGGAPVNIGIATGAASGRLVDVDLDCAEAVVAASTLLPCTGLRSGRTTRPQSHYWYTLHPTAGLVAGGIPSLRLSIPSNLFARSPHPTAPEGGANANANAGDGSAHDAVLVELRYDGHQTIVEPSLHPSGEAVEWQATDDAKEVTALVLLRAVGRVAAAALLARYWAPRGHRDECALALTGALLRMGWTTADTDVFVRAVARAAGDDEWRQRRKAAAIAARLSDLPNAPTRGWPSVAELLAAPSGERVTTLARVWLGYGSDSAPAPHGPRVRPTPATGESPTNQGVARAGRGSGGRGPFGADAATDFPTGADVASAAAACAGPSMTRSGAAWVGTPTPQPRAGRSEYPPDTSGHPPDALSRRTSLVAGAEPQWGVLVADVPESAVAWLWPGRIPLGMITLLDGDPGLGKSLVCTDLAARVSRGLPMPDGTGGAEPGEHGEPGEPAGVILLSNEDSLSATIRPRLEAAGADLSRVIAEQSVTETDPSTGAARQRPLVLPADVAVLEAAIRRIGARLLIIDPLMAYLSANVNTWRDQDVRAALAPLARVAENTGTAILVLRHLNKATALANALYRGGGSIGIIGAARSALLVGPAPDNEQHRILAVNKSNLAGPQPSLRYSVERAAGALAPSVVWHGEASYTARTLLTGRAAEGSDAARREAESFLVAQLGGGPLPSAELNLRAARAGFAARTVERARKRLQVGTFRVGFGKGSKVMAQLPYEPRADAPKADAPKADAPKADVPKADVPKQVEAPAAAPAPKDLRPPEPRPARTGLRLVVEAGDAAEGDAAEGDAAEEDDGLPFADRGDEEDGEDDEDEFLPYPWLHDDEDDEDDEEAWEVLEEEGSGVPTPCTLCGQRHEFADDRRDEAGRPVCDACGWALLVPAPVAHAAAGEREAVEREACSERA